MNQSLDDKKSIKIPLGARNRLYFLIASCLVAVISVSLPLFGNLATPIQSLNLYIGTVFAKGQSPYLDLFTTGGFLFHSLTGLASHFGGTYWLIPVQSFCFYLAGYYLFKICQYLSGKEAVSRLVVFLYYLFNLLLGFGNFYPIQLASPFVFMGIWFLLTYFDDQRKDEVFISYGLVSALSLFLEPKTLVFWLLAFILLTVYNIRHKRLARGFYQNLSLLFGLILVVYSMGYLILNMQLLLPYIQQSLIYNFTNLVTEGDSSWLGLGLQLFGFLGLGLLPALVSWVKQSQSSWTWLVSLNLLVYLVYALGTQSNNPDKLLYLLPFALLILATWLGKEAGQEEEHHRRHSRHREKPLKTYLKSSFYLPLLLVVFGLARPIALYIDDLKLYQDRQAISSYLSGQLTDQDKIYLWDNSVKVGTDLAAFSASQFVLPTIDTAASANEDLLVDELLQLQATYLVVNPALPLSQNLEKDLLEHYEQVPVKGLSSLTLYQQKD